MDRIFSQSPFLLFMVLMFAVCTECSNVANMQCSSTYKSLGYIGQNHFFYMDKAVGWHEANRTCYNYPNTHLATFSDEYELHVISQRILPIVGTSLGMKTSFWFGAHEVTFAKWTWLDDQIYDGAIMDYDKKIRNTKKTCGLVDVANAVSLAYATCIRGKRFLCVNPESESMDLGVDDYYISNTAEAVSWFRAREICLCRGMDLAMSKEGSVDYIYTLLNGSTNHFWIGLQKARFVWENTGEAIEYLPFKKNQPDDFGTYEDCLHVVEGLYNDIYCNAKYKFICEHDNVVHLPKQSPVAQPPKTATRYQSELTKETPGEKKPEDKRGNAGIIVAVVISVLVVAAVTALVLALAIRRSNNENKGNRWLRFGNTAADEGI